MTTLLLLLWLTVPRVAAVVGNRQAREGLGTGAVVGAGARVGGGGRRRPMAGRKLAGGEVTATDG